MQITFSEIKRH